MNAINEVYVTKVADKYVKPVRWIASLSNGETIFEDHKPGEESAWKRLSLYVRTNAVAITRMRLQINELEITIPPHAPGYVQKKKIISTGGFSQLQYCVGHLESNGMCLIHYVGEDRSSYSEIIPDPGHPFTIYSHDGICDRSCCANTVSS